MSALGEGFGHLILLSSLATFTWSVTRTQLGESHSWPRLERPEGVELHWEQRGQGPLVVLAPLLVMHPDVFDAARRGAG